jgi:hypothetical protein
MAVNISNTIKQFRQDVIDRGGPQISGMYKVEMLHNGDNLTCYPLSIVIPGRQFVYYEHDLWGPNRKIPYKRGYTQCHMTFIVYQDWAERSFIEKWMNTIVRHKQATGVSDSIQQATNPAIDTDEITAMESLANTFINGSLMGDAQFNLSEYDDFIDYTNGFGRMNIHCLNSQDKSVSNLIITLKEVFPAAISQMSMASDGSGYPTFNVTFQFNDYIYLPQSNQKQPAPTPTE